VRAASILCATALLGTLAASPAAGAVNDVSTASVEWQSVDDATGAIGDALAHDAPGALVGWTNDAFDGFGRLTVTEPGTGQSWLFVADSSTSTIIDGETADWVLTGSPKWAGFDYRVTLTLSLKGNSARWSYAITGGPTGPPTAAVATGDATGIATDIAAVDATGITTVGAPGPNAGLTVSFGGRLGSNDATTYAVSGSTLISDDGGYGPEKATDPVLGYAVTTDGAFAGWSADSGSDSPVAAATGVTEFSVDLVYADYNSCGFAAAHELVASLLPDLPRRFGAVYPVTGDCVAFDAVTLELGVPVDQDLVLHIDPRLEAAAFFEQPIEILVADLPAGLGYTAEQNPTDRSILMRVTGTPTEVGDFAASTVFSVRSRTQSFRVAVQLPGSMPVYGAIAFRIVPAAAVIVPPAPTTTPAPKPAPTKTPTPPATVTPPVVTPRETTGTPSGPTPATTPAPTAVTSLSGPTSVPVARVSTPRALPSTGIDLGRSLGVGLLAILCGVLMLTSLALRSDARVARNASS